VVMSTRDVIFRMKVLGRMLELLGTQMYKRRDTALAELVANAWDAGARRVDVAVPVDGYDPATSEITVADDGTGMTEDQVANGYMIVGRNRRSAGDVPPPGRTVMGRKGIGKLAGFGIADTVEVETTSGGRTTRFAMEMRDLKRGENEVAEAEIGGTVENVGDVPTGTMVRLKGLKQVTAPDRDALMLSLGRRFSRVVHGEMAIRVNGERVGEPEIDFERRVPPDEWAESQIDGCSVRYFYGFSKKPIRQTLLRGFTLYANGKTAQAPPFFFGVEATASGQHATRYLYGAVEVDYLDEGIDDESDLISTDRQQVDWEAPETAPLLAWGDELTRKAFREWVDGRQKTVENAVLEDEDLSRRIERLDKPSRTNLMKAVRVLARAEADPDKLLALVGSLVAAFEYRHFHDVATKIEELNDPEALATLLEHLGEWKVLESRAILEVVRGRLQIIDKFHSMIVKDAPETAPRKGVENLHDLIADYPWLLDPQWQVLAEEKTITRQLREWGHEDIDPEDRQRYDFLALAGPDQLVVVEIKRSGHAVTLEDVHRLQRYCDRLRLGSPEITMALVSGPGWETSKDHWKNHQGLQLLEWATVHKRTRRFYDHYRAVLEADVDNRDFHAMEKELARTREVLADGAYRGPALRKQGLGPQYAEGYGAGPMPGSRD